MHLRYDSEVRKPLSIDLYCGLGGWAEGFLAEGWDEIAGPTALGRAWCQAPYRYRDDFVTLALLAAAVFLVSCAVVADMVSRR